MKPISKFGLVCYFLPITDAEETELEVTKKEAKVIIDFDPRKLYTVKVTAVKGAQESKPLLGTFEGEKSLIPFTTYSMIS